MKLSLAVKKAKDRLAFLKAPVTKVIGLPRKTKKIISQGLRRSETVRGCLALPSPVDVSLKDYFSNNTNGDKWVQIMEGGAFSHSVPKLNHSGSQWYFESKKEVALDPVGFAVLNNGFVHGHNGGQYLNAKGEFIWDLGRENWRYFGNLWMDSVLHMPEPVHLTGRTGVLMHEYAFDNFSHWVFDLLPKIDVLRRHCALQEYDHFLVGHSGKRYQLEALAHLGIPADKIIQFTPEGYYQADELVAPRLYGYNSMHHRSWVIDYLRASFASGMEVKSPRRRLFISRSDASFRNLHGEEALFSKLQKFGFENVVLAGVSLGETIALFNEAEMVVGPFGSGLMNIAFCQPKTKVVEIITPAFYNCYHWYLTGERGLDHAVYVGDGGRLIPGKSPNQSTKNIQIDVDDCFSFISRTLSLQ